MTLFGDKDKELIASQQKLDTWTSAGSMFRVHNLLRTHLADADEKTLESVNITSSVRDNFCKRELALTHQSELIMGYDFKRTAEEPEYLHLVYDEKFWPAQRNIPLMAKVMSHEAGHFFTENSEQVSDKVLSALRVPAASSDAELHGMYATELFASSLTMAATTPSGFCAVAAASAVVSFGAMIIGRAAQRVIEKRCDNYADRLMPMTSSKELLGKFQDKDKNVFERLLAPHPSIKTRIEQSKQDGEKYYNETKKNGIKLFMW